MERTCISNPKNYLLCSVKSPSDAEKKIWIAEMRCKCFDAVRTLESAKKQSSSAYDRRLRIINAFEEVLYVKQQDDGQLELFDLATACPPETQQLLEDPTHGL